MINFNYFPIYIFLIFLSILIKFVFPNDYNSYLIFFIISLFSLILIFFVKDVRIIIFLFIILFLAGSHKEIQKKYFSFMSVMHWNDGIKIFASVPYNLLMGNYDQNLKNILKKDKGNNSGIIEIEEIFNLIQKNNIIKYSISNNLQEKINESVLFKQRLKEITYPSKLNKNNIENNYIKFYEADEIFPENCTELDRIKKIKLIQC